MNARRIRTPRLYRNAQGQLSRLCYIGHVSTDNRHALVVDAETTHASGTDEVDAALRMLNRRPGKRRLTVSAGKARVTPHVARNNNGRRSAIDARTTRHAGYAQSVNARHRVETPFGWGKFNRPLRQTMLRGLDRVAAQAKRVFASYNLMRTASLEAV